MRCVIVLNGEYIDNFDFKKDDFLIACDGAYSKLINKGIVPDEVLGDFDSLGFVPEGAVVFPVEKDMTDGELALSRAKDKGFPLVAIICAGGGREDHFIGNISLLYKAFDLGMEAELYTRRSIVRYLGEGRHRFSVKKETVVSLFSFGGAFVTESKGLKYPYRDYHLLPSSTLGISNKAEEDEISFTVKEGGLLFFINN